MTVTTTTMTMQMTRQSVNQSINQSTNPSINQSINQSIDCPRDGGAISPASEAEVGLLLLTYITLDSSTLATYHIPLFVLSFLRQVFDSPLYLDYHF